MKLKLFVLTVLCTLSIAACAAPAATPPPASEGGNPDFGFAPAATSAAQPPASGGAGEDGAAATTERLIIKNADLSLVVDDPASAVEAITRLTEGMNGFVVSVNSYQTTYGGSPAYQARMTIRIPGAKLNEALAQIKALAVEVRSENISGQDVTAEYVDLQSRLGNLEAKERQLQSIMEEASQTEDVLAVYDKLAETREQIEVIKGQMKYYEQAAAMSAVSLELIPNAASQPVEIGGWRPEGVAKESIEILVRIVQGLIDFLIRFSIICGPFLIVLGIPALVIAGWVIKKARGANQKGTEGK